MLARVKASRQKAQVSFQVGWPRFRVGLRTSKDPTKKILPSHAQLLGLWLIEMEPSWQSRLASPVDYSVSSQ